MIVALNWKNDVGTSTYLKGHALICVCASNEF